jgi:hypothetical protein
MFNMGAFGYKVFNVSKAAFFFSGEVATLKGLQEHHMQDT